MVDDIWPLSARVIAIKIQTRPKPITIVQVYAPIAESTTEELETFYEDLEKALKNARKDGQVFVMGDLNAKIGKGAEGWVVDDHGLGERNEREDKLVEYTSGHTENHNSCQHRTYLKWMERICYGRVPWASVHFIREGYSLAQ